MFRVTALGALESIRKPPSSWRGEVNDISVRLLIMGMEHSNKNLNRWIIIYSRIAIIWKISLFTAHV